MMAWKSPVSATTVVMLLSASSRFMVKSASSAENERDGLVSVTH
jgi:hypothetical protein